VTAGGIGDAPNVIINNHTDAQPTIDRSPNGDVTVTLRRTMDAATADSLSGGSGRRVLAQQFGLKQFTGQ